MAKDTRVWRYKDGEAKLFARREDVPAGWTDSPAKKAKPVEKKPAKPAAKPAKKAAK